MQALALSCLLLLAADAPRTVTGVDTDAVLQRMAAMDAPAQQTYLADLEKRLDRANRILLPPREADERSASVAMALRQKVVGWDIIRELVQETDRRERAAIGRLVRMCRMRVYEAYYGDRKEYDLRLDALNRVSESWQKQATFDDQPMVMNWMAGAVATAMPETKGPLPPEPKFGRGPDAAATAAATPPRATPGGTSTPPPTGTSPSPSRSTETPKPETPKPETPKPETPKPETPKPPPADDDMPKPPSHNEPDAPQRTAVGAGVAGTPTAPPEAPEKAFNELKNALPTLDPLPSPDAMRVATPTKVAPPATPTKTPVKTLPKESPKTPAKPPVKSPPDENPFDSAAGTPIYEAPLSIELEAAEMELARAAPGVGPQRVAMAVPRLTAPSTQPLTARGGRLPIRRELTTAIGAAPPKLTALRVPREVTVEEPVSVAADDPAPVQVNVAELAARIAGNGMQLRALEEELDDDRGDFSPAALDKTLRRLSRLVDEQRHLAGFYTLVHVSDRPRLGEFESPLVVAAQLARRIRDAQRAAAGDNFAGGPQERQSRLDLLDGMVQSLEKLRAGR